MAHKDPEYVLYRAEDGKLAVRTVRHLQGGEDKVEDPEPEATNKIEIESLSNKELQELAKKAGLKFNNKTKKEELIRLLKGEEIAPEDPEDDGEEDSEEVE